MTIDSDTLDEIQNDLDPAPDASEIHEATDAQIEDAHAVYGTGLQEVAGIIVSVITSDLWYTLAVARRDDGRWIAVGLS